MLNRKNAGMLSVIGLASVLMSGAAVNAFAETSPSSKGTSNVPTAPVQDPRPSYDVLADRLAKKLDLNDKTRNKVSELFKADGKAIRVIQNELAQTQAEISSLSPTEKGYLKEVDKLADERGELTKELTVAYAKNRVKLYKLLTPTQIEALEGPSHS